MKPQQVTMLKNLDQPTRERIMKQQHLTMPHSVFNGGGALNNNGPSPKGKLLTKSEQKAAREESNLTLQDQSQQKVSPSITQDGAIKKVLQGIPPDISGGHRSNGNSGTSVVTQNADPKQGQYNSRFQKPPIASTMQNTPNESKKINENEIYTQNKKNVMNKRVAIPISQVGLQTSSPTITKPHSQSQEPPITNTLQVRQQKQQQQSNGYNNGQQRYSNSNNKEGGGPSASKEDTFQLPDVNSRQQLIAPVGLQQQNQTPLPRSKKQQILIPNNQFHFVVGQNSNPLSANNQALQQSPFKFQNSQKFNMTQQTIQQPFQTKYGVIVAQNEPTVHRKRLLSKGSGEQQQNSPQIQQSLDEFEKEYIYGSIPEETSPNETHYSNPSRRGQQEIYQSIQGPSNMIFPQNYPSPTGQKVFQDSNGQQQTVYIRSRQPTEEQKDLYIETPKKDLIFNSSLKSRQRGLEGDPMNRNVAITEEQLIMSGSDGQFIHVMGGQSERSDDFGNQKNRIELNQSTEGISASEGNSFLKDQNRKFIAPIHQQQIFMSDMIPAQAQKTQTGFAVRKGQLVKTQTQFGGQFQAMPKPRLSNESLIKNGKVIKIKKDVISNAKVKLKDDTQTFHQRVLAAQNKLSKLLSQKCQIQNILCCQYNLYFSFNEGERLEQAFQQAIHRKGSKGKKNNQKKNDPANFLNIQRIEAPVPQPNRNIGSRGTTDQTSRLAKQSSIAKGYKQNIMVEQYLDPETVCKFGLTKRLLFKRRQPMRDKNLIIIFFGGVIGDLPYSSGNCLGFNSFRIRSGALKELKELSFQHQVVLVLPYVSKRSTVIGRYLHKFAACQVDAVYSVKSKEAKSTKKSYLKRWQDYEQVYRDFNMNDHQKILEEVLVIGCYTAELDGTMNQDGATDISELVDDRFPELMGASGIRMRNEAEDYNRVNPITIMVPHRDLEIGSHCPISVLFQTIEVLKNTLLKYRQNPSIQYNERDSRGPLDKARETLFSSQSKSRLLNINPEWLPKINFMETFTQLKEYELDLTTPPYEVGAATTGRIWKLQCFESGHLQRVILQHEKLADHLKVKTFQHRTELIKKYTKEDGTMDLPSYEETHPECPLHQFATLLNDNQATNLNIINSFSSSRLYFYKVKAIDDYRQRYLSRTDKGYRQLVETLRFPPYDPAEDHCKGVNINDVKLDMRIDQYTMHRMIFLVPSPSVIQKVQTTGQYNQAFEYVDISKELADNVPYELASLIQANQQSTFEFQDWICRRMFTRPQNNGFIGPSGLAKRKGQQYVDADFHPTVPPGTGPAGNGISNSMGT